MKFEYENIRRVVYEEGATFIPVCENCGRFVKKDREIWFNELGQLKEAPNATCKKCGRVQMIFEGYY